MNMEQRVTVLVERCEVEMSELRKCFEELEKLASDAHDVRKAQKVRIAELEAQLETLGSKLEHMRRAHNELVDENRRLLEKTWFLQALVGLLTAAVVGMVLERVL